MGRQLLRSGTSVGAQIAEATYAKSRADFISKMQGSLQELCETKYWLDLLVEAELIERARLNDLYDETNQLMAIVTAIIGKSVKNR